MTESGLFVIDSYNEDKLIYVKSTTYVKRL